MLATVMCQVTTTLQMENLDEKDINKILQEDFKKVTSVGLIYKYSDFNSAVNKILVENTLKFSNPTNYNDPFDCHESLIDFKPTKEIIHETLMSSPTGKHLPRQFRRKIERNATNATNLYRALVEERGKYKVSCFAESKENELLWGHYADKHNGICIGFEFSPVYEDKFQICPVRYLGKIVPIDGSSGKTKTILYWLTTKSTIWEYEQEFRAIMKAKNDTSSELVTFKPNVIKEVIFGCKVTEPQIKTTIKQIKGSHREYSKIKFTKMKINPSNFSLKEIEIVPGT